MDFSLRWNDDRPLSRARRVFMAAGLAALLAGCAGAGATRERHLFYLHGAIIEQQGPRAVSERFGSYDYAGILGKFREGDLQVHSETRPKDTDVDAYARKVAAEIEDLIQDGVPPSHITVVGASKGAVIATLVSARLRNPNVRYVLMAACNDWLIETHDPRLSGEVLSIYEQSDEIAGSCKAVADRSPDVARYEEIRLDTGLGHGFLYRPLTAWVAPAVRWAKR